MWLTERKNFVDKVKKLTGKDDLRLYTKEDKNIVSKLIAQAIKESNDVKFKGYLFSAFVMPLKIKLDRNLLLSEIFKTDDDLYRGYVGFGLSYILKNTSEDIALTNRLISEGVGSLFSFAKKINSPETLLVAEKCLEGNDEPMINAAIETLGFIGDEDTITKLQPFLKSKSCFTRPEAKKAIARIEKRFSQEAHHLTALPPNIRRLTASIIKEYLDSQDRMHEYSAEFDFEYLSKLWKAYQKKISILSVLDVSELIDIFEEANQDEPRGFEIKGPNGLDTIKVIVYHFDYDVVRLCFFSNNSTIIEKLEKVTDKII